MADLADVERAIVSLAAGALFTGTYQPGAYAVASNGTTTAVYRGWPVQATLLADILAHKAHVSVFPEHGVTRNVSRWFPAPMQVSTVAPTIAAFVSGSTVTLSGTITAGNVVGIQGGSPLTAYARIVQTGDTLATVAAALAAKVTGATASGAVITMPNALHLSAGTMTPQTVLTTTRQQEQGFRISVWAPTPQVRDALAGAIDNAIAGLVSPAGFPTRWFKVGTFESAKIVYRATYVTDAPARDQVWRRDLTYNVEFCTSLIEQDPVMLFGGGTETAGGMTRQFGAIAPN